MHRSESIDWLLNYRAVLVANAVRAVRETPFAMAVTVTYPAAKRRSWQKVPADAGAWRAVAVAAGAVARD